MSRPPKLGELTTVRREELRAALREVDHRLRAYPDPNPRVVLEEVCRDLHGHPGEFRAWVAGYCAGLVQTVPDLVDDTMKAIERIRDGLLP